MNLADSDRIKFITNYFLNEEDIIEILGIKNFNQDSRVEIINGIIGNDLVIPGYFDSEYYLSKYVDVYHSGMLAIEHYLLFGRDEGREPYNPEWSSIVDEMREYKEYKAVHKSNNGHLKIEYEIDSEYYIEDSSINSFKVLSCKWFDAMSSEEFMESNNLFSIISKYNYSERVRIYFDIKRLVKQAKINHECKLDLLLEFAFSSNWNISDLDRPLASLECNHFDLFDVEFVNKELNIEGDSLLNIYSNWFNNYRHLSPNKYFISDYYVSEYPDLKGLEYPFEHYVFNGRYEGRKPNQFVSNIFFGRHEVCQYKSTSLIDKYPFLNNFKEISVSTLNYIINSLKDVVRNDNDIRTIFSFINNKFFIDFFEAKSLEEAIVCWKECNYTDKAILLFDKDYLSKVLNYNLNDFRDAFLSWKKLDDLKSISPTPIFDENYYLERYTDLNNSSINAFEHYLNHGQYENRSPCRYLDPLWIRNTYNIGTLSGLEFFACSNEKVKPSAGLMPIGIDSLGEICNSSFEKQWFDINNNKILREQLEKANKIDPRIKIFDHSRIYTLMPFNVDFYSVIKGLESKISKTDILIFRDSINFGGADVVLGHLYRSLKLVNPNKNIKIISFGKVEENVLSSRGINAHDVIDLERLKGNIPLEYQANVVYDIVIGTEAKEVYNVNSYGAWEAFKNYGKSLSSEVKLFAYLFCDDRDDFGNIVGYPASYFFSTIEYITFAYLDSVRLLFELEARGAIIDRYKSKIKVLKTPFEPLIIKNSIRTPKANNKVAWAGRFDEQKKPELLIEIAKLMPEYEFHVWGKPVLSTKKYDFSQADNIVLHGLYENISELLEEECSVYLYTSGWDGIPTILLDVVNLELPIVASDVGGVSEAVPSWALIDNIDNAGEYVNRIQSILSEYSNSVDGMRKHKEMLLEVCSFDNYCFEIGNSND